MTGVVWWQALLNALGAVLAWVYGLIPNYGVAIIVLTLGIRFLLLPLAIKQIRSMQAMQAMQPKVRAIQQKYKGNRQKINEETMKLYKEHGVNPVAGCLPMLLQFPILIALFYVLRMPSGLAHVPSGSALERAIVTQDTRFLGMNLLCAPAWAGRDVPIPKAGPAVPRFRDDRYHCGQGPTARVPYYILVLAMIGTMYWQQRQTQRTSPTPQQAQQQRLIGMTMTVVFGFFGFSFPAGLVVYWTVQNLVQIVQQQFMLSRQPVVGTEAAASAGGPSQRRRQESPLLRWLRGEVGGRPASSGGDSRGGREGSEGPGGKPGQRRPEGGKPGGGRGGTGRKKRRKR